MIDTRLVRDEADTRDLVETYSTENFKLKQVETDVVYGSSVIDVIEGYKDRKPYSRFTYVETDEKDEPIDEATEDDYKSALNELGVETNE